MTPQQYVEEKAQASGSSFYYAFRFLPPAQREAITAFYVFCRLIDDAVDDIDDAAVAAQTLAWWRQEVAQAYTMVQLNQRHPILQALMPHAEAFRIEEAHLQAIIQGCMMDVQQNRYADYDSLKGYCHLVAGVVGEVSANIFAGETKMSDEQRQQVVAYAHKLGLALQLTNIIRDVGEDMARDRVYLPQEDLHRFGVSENQLRQREYTDAFAQLMQFQYERAADVYDEALALLPAEQRRAQKPGLMMASIYRALLNEIANEKFQVLHQRIALTPMRKLWLAWKMQALGRF